jgi:hypothetical protein
MSDEGWEDDDMADLFSFGTEGAPNPVDDNVAAAAAVANNNSSPMSTPEEVAPPERVLSNDSILDMLDGEMSTTAETSVLSTPTMQDQDAQDILKWLDEEDNTAPPAETTTETKVEPTDEKKESETSKEEKKAVEETKEAAVSDEKKATESTTQDTDTYSEPTPTIAVIPPPTRPPPIHFESLDDALDSPVSTIENLRTLFVDGGMKVDPKRRAALWCRTVCGKTLEDVESSSLAESFLQWLKTTNVDQADDERSVYIRKEAAILAERIVAGTGTMTVEEAKDALCQVLFFYYQSSSTNIQEVDPLLPPVACAILSAGVSPAATTCMLTQIMPTYMPLLALTQEERWEAAKSLHTQFYLLACYHLPLLVFHLDRYVPGWQWPKKLGELEGDESATEKGRNLESHGFVPQSWLISHLAGECGGTLINPVWLLSLWDLILTSSNNSLRFFLSLAVLEKYSDTLLMLTGDELLNELQRIMEFKEGTTPEGFAIVAEEETSRTEAGDSVQEWCDRSRALWEATPRSVVSRLRTAEDEAVTAALLKRQKKAEDELNARLEAEARAHREAAEAEKERLAEEARLRLSRARLVAYYRTHAPDKEGNVDKIMEVYKGRLDVLDMKLKAKYGVSFKPALKPKPSTTQKLLSTVNQGLSSRRNVTTAVEASSKPKPGHHDHQVVVKVTATEVLPVICWSKEAASSKGVTALARGRYNDEFRVPLKFYLIDSRPEATAEEQGRFPTAVVVSPEALLDPDRIQQHEEMFESLRGAVHICIMGEGFSAVPELYNQKVTPKLLHYIEEDESRTSLCALFFVKKGFPFVSILDGGFVQAHAWLCREGPKKHLDAASVLVDYDEDNSFFGKLEKSYRTQQELANASTVEKTQHVLQNLIDSSMVQLTKAVAEMDKRTLDAEASSKRKSVSKISTTAIDEEAVDVVEEEESFLGSPVNAGDEEQLEEESSEVNFVSRFASKLNIKTEKDVPETDDKLGDGSKTNEESAEAKFKNPFAGFRKPEAADAGIETSDQERDATTAAAVFRNPFATRKSVVPEKGHAGDTVSTKEESVDDPDLVDVSMAPESNVQGKLSRFARAASSSIQKVAEQQAVQKNALKKNPFARFGGGKPTEKQTQGDGTKVGLGSNRFGGINMNQLRKTTLSNLRGKSDVNKQEDMVEESISFDHDITSGSVPVAVVEEKKPEKSEGDAVVKAV